MTANDLSRINYYTARKTGDEILSFIRHIFPDVQLTIKCSGRSSDLFHISAPSRCGVRIIILTLDSGVEAEISNELTAAGTVPDFHRIPFSFLVRKNKSDLETNAGQMYDFSYRIFADADHGEKRSFVIAGIITFEYPPAEAHALAAAVRSEG